MAELLYKDEVYAIVGAPMEVYNQRGPGFLEAIYQEALEIELRNRNLPFISPPELAVFYKNRQLHKHYVADFIVYERIAVEIKALSCLTSDHESQLINQLRATGLEVGILVNFGHPHKLECERMICTPKKVADSVYI
jgi:GxxExxY protein